MDLSLVPNIKNLEANNFFLLAGPCAIEGEDMALRIAEKVVSITNDLKIPYVFKGSFRKANRSRIDSFTGIGDEKALKILRKVSETFGVPTVTDIHEAADAEKAAEYVDVLQIPESEVHLHILLLFLHLQLHGCQLLLVLQKFQKPYVKFLRLFHHQYP